MDERNEKHHRPHSNLSQLLRLAKAYLPLIISVCAVVIILVIVIGSATRAVQRGIYNHQVSEASAAAQQALLEEQMQEAADLLEEADSMARHFDYAGAANLLLTFSGEIKEYPELQQKYDQYKKAQDELVLWSDPDTIPNLSFQTLIADPQRAFKNYNKSYVTTAEFYSILQQLYANNYILINLSDIATSSGAKALYLPAGKKPLILTQTGVNYYNEMIDSDGDYLPDANGSGFASKLVIDENGNITCEMVDSSGATVHGAYDLIPILDSFVETHPDFSYRGAKAVIAVTGYDGIFGYRTNMSAYERLGAELYAQECESAAQIADLLRETGYEIAYYSYSNTSYSELDTATIAAEMQLWKEEMHPIVGFSNIFVFCQNSDLASATKSYTDEKFDTLYAAGFRYYLGFCKDNTPWFSSHGKYIRQGRILVNGSNMKYSPELFNDLFDPATVLDTTRGI